MSAVPVIAIDGPSARAREPWRSSGRSAGFNFLEADRCTAGRPSPRWIAAIPLDDSDAVAALARHLDVRFAGGTIALGDGCHPGQPSGPQRSRPRPAWRRCSRCAMRC